MSIFSIPASVVDSWYRQTITLEGVQYVGTFAWSERARAWYLDLSTADGTVLRSGIKIVADRPLTERMTDDLRPAGDIWSIDRTGGGVDPDIRDLGSRVILYYVESAARD